MPKPMNAAVAHYLRSCPPARRVRLKQIHDLIVELFPQARADMAYRMPTYHLGEGWVAVANQKHYISLYTCGYHHIEGFKARHPGIKTGKGCINFRDRDELPLADLKEVIRHAIEHPKPVR